jgi:hypothetical protein
MKVRDRAADAIGPVLTAIRVWIVGGDPKKLSTDLPDGRLDRLEPG